MSRATSMFDRNKPYESYGDHFNTIKEEDRLKKINGYAGSSRVSPQPEARTGMPDLTKPYKIQFTSKKLSQAAKQMSMYDDDYDYDAQIMADVNDYNNEVKMIKEEKAKKAKALGAFYQEQAK